MLRIPTRRCVVHVVTSNEANWYLQYVPAAPSTEPAAEKHVFLTYVAPVHYDALTLDLSGVER